MSGSLRRDDNFVPVAGGISNTDANAVLPFKIDSVTGRLLVDSASAAGTVTSMSIVTANGFAGTVATPTTTPAVTLTTTISGLLKGNLTAISAAVAGTDYSAGTAALGTGILKSTTATGALTIAVAGDFPTLNQNTTGTAAGLTTGRTISITGDLAYTSPAFDGTGNITGAGTLATVNSNTGAWGSATQVGTFTVNGKGLITAAGNTTVTPAVGSITGLAAGVATFLATPSSANLITAVTDETGSGALVFGTTPTLATPVINGAITGTGQATLATASTITMRDSSGNTSVNNLVEGFTTTATAAGTTTMTIASTFIQIWTGSSTQTVKLPTTSVLQGQQYLIINQSTGAVTVQSSGANTITILAANTSALFTAVVATPTTAANWASQYSGVNAASGKVATINNTLTFSGTDATTMTFPGTNATVARIDAAQTFAGTQTFTNALVYTNNAIAASANAATVPITAKLNTVTNSSAATLTITMTTGAADGQMTIVRILDFSAVAQTITWVNTENSTVSAPTTSNGSTTLPLTVGFMYNAATSKWRCIASA